MNKIKFPKLPPKTKVAFIMTVGDDQVACVIKKEVIKYYYWDQISLSWNKCDVYERIK
jgi:hypothetical protein